MSQLSVIKDGASALKAMLSSAEAQNALRQSLPTHITPERMTRVVLSAFVRQPMLAECMQSMAGKASLYQSILDASSLGLEPDSLGRAYLVPYRRKDTMCCQLIIGYKGLLDLARRSDQIMSMQAQAVYAKDHFRYSYGRDEVFEHIPHDGEDRGPLRCTYAYAHLRGGGFVSEVCLLRDIERAKSRSQSKSGPWSTDYEAMAIKTAVRRLARWLPMTAQMSQALEKDGDQIADSTSALSVDDIQAPEEIGQDDLTPSVEAQQGAAEK